MLIQCTKKLLDELKVTAQEQFNENPLFSWHANIIKLGRKKTIVLVNDQTRYAIVLYGVKAKDLKNLSGLFLRSIREIFKAEGVKPEIIEQFIQKSGEASFTKTKDRSLVARMNRACEDFYFMTDLIDEESIAQVGVSMKISSLLAGAGKGTYINPNEELYKSLEEMAGQPVFHSEAAQLKVTLLLENHSVWRRITVPTNYNLKQLHNVLQIAFNWQNSHLYEFRVTSKNQPLVKIVSFKDAYDEETEIPMKMDSEVELSQCLESSILYTYDFGDNWQHEIEVEKVVQDYKVNYPVCTDGEGSAPPEDVGGEPGFEEFLRVISDKSHPENEHMTGWGEMQGYETFNPNEVNWRLKKE
ncbi:plasmid pRiA4b ORF-3 family protein [Rossellomorea vietnamensis]|uniref:Plasmid pRiA4b ORF-3 family protein n=1 Tax=Rossellomorea aquimaris TaxID=189382 RepID=A0A5D4TTG0_9BACI|nr:plasmid pRiA4b ORF-3 family protein [Rossellomorea aquimaris]TYS78485.1 plasmid pRiA4b ORF-3 family protein [Rossellomorea aquimaris]